MRASLLFTVLLSMISIHLSAIEKPGYIITNQNDTIYGYIDFVKLSSCTYECSFKKNTADKPTIYTPGSIKAFRFTDAQYFISKQIPTKAFGNSDAQYFSTNTPVVEGEMKWVFLQWLIKGKANILAFNQDVSHTLFYLQQDKDSLVELPNSIAIKKTDDGTFEVHKKEYQGLLKYYLKDQPELSQQIESLKYDASSLVKLGKTYHVNACGNADCIIYQDKTAKTIFSIAPILSYFQADFKGSSDPKQELNPMRTVGVGLCFNWSKFAFLPQAISLQLEFSFLKGTLQSSLQSSFLSNGTYIYTKDRYSLAKMQAVRIPFDVCYNFNYQRLSAYTGVGVTEYLRKVTVENGLLLSHLVDASTMVTDESFTHFQVALNAKIGMAYELNTKLSIELGATFERANDYTNIISSQNLYNYNFILQTGLFYNF